MRSLDEVRALMADRKNDAKEMDAPHKPSLFVRRAPEHPPLSVAQRTVWAQQQLEPMSTAYNLCLLMRFTVGDEAEPQELDAEALADAFRVMVRRHEALRTTYPVGEDGEPWQRVHDDLEPEIRCHVGTVIPDIEELARSEARRPFDLSVDSPLRVDVVSVDARTLYAVVVVQHIIWDGMTMAVLAREVEAAYRGDATSLPQLDTQVVDFAAFDADREIRDADAVRADQDYWATVFDKAVPQLELSVDGDHQAPAGRGGRIDRTLSEGADAQLRELAATLRVSPFTIFVAAYHLVLRLVAGQDRTVIGTTVVNREEPGQELLFGNFSNQIPLLVDSEDPLTFGDLVTGGPDSLGVARVISGAFRHKLLPTEAIAAAAGVDRGNGEHLCNTMVLFLTRDIAGPQLPGASTSWDLVDSGAALYPLAVEAFQHESRTDVQFTYRCDSLSPETVTGIADMLDTILATATPEISLEELLVPGRADREFLDRYARGPRCADAPETVDNMARKAAAAHPDHPAVTICGNPGENTQTLTYTEFDGQVNRLTRELLARGVATGDRVLVNTGREPVLPVVLMAILRAGATYVPVDPGYPERRIRQILDDAEPTLVVLAATHGRGTENYGDIAVVDLNNAATAAAVEAQSSIPVDPTELSRPLNGDDGCYLIYTSGSTGRPKGVLNHHRGVANHLHWYGSTFLAGHTARVLHKAPVTFDVGIAEILNPLTTGGTAIIPPFDWWEGDAHALVDMVEMQKVDILSLVPSYLQVILDTVEDPSRMACIDRIILGGEAVPGHLALRAREAFNCRVFSLYGPTEAAMDVTWVEFTPNLTVGDGETLIGIPEDNTTVRVVDRRGRELPVGIPGELCLVGVQVATGYRNLPERTAEAFGTSPFPGDRGERMYRTGDIVQWRRDGILRFLGRANDQVKIRGNRVELGEVEASLSNIPGIRHAAARAWSHERGVRLIGYIVVNDATVGVSEEDIAASMKQRVPSYMVPDTILVLPELPMNGNGKLDRARLPEPEEPRVQRNGGASENSYLTTKKQRVVAEIFASVLSLSELPGPNNDLFSLGGDSIAAIRVVAALRARGYTVGNREVLEARTVAGIASAVTADDSGDNSGGEHDVTTAPMPPLARQLLDSHADGGGLVQYTVLTVPAATTGIEISKRLNRLVRRHPVLAARVESDTGDITLPSSDDLTTFLDVTVENNASLSVDDVEAASQAAMTLVRHIRPNEGKMLVAGLFGVGEDGTRQLVVVVSHLVVDGVSWRLIAAELATDDSAPQPEQAFLRWSRMLRDSEAETRKYDAEWERIARAAAGDITLDPSEDVESTAHEVHISVESGIVTRLVSAAETMGCELLDIQIAAAVRALQTVRGQSGLGIGVTLEGHGRDNHDAMAAHAEDAIGWFTAAYPIVVSPGEGGVDDGQSILHAVRAARRELPEDTARPGVLRASGQIVATPPDLCLNYLGSFAHAGLESLAAQENGGINGAADTWRPASGIPAVGGLAGPQTPLGSAIDLTTDLTTAVDGSHDADPRDTKESVLHAMVRVAGRHIDRTAATRFLNQWVAELTLFAQRGNFAAGPAPADLTARNITAEDLIGWSRTLGRRIVDVLPLTPLQSGLMLSSLSTGGSDGYLVQSVVDVEDPGGVLNATTLGIAGDVVSRNHPNLRIIPVATREGIPVGVVTDTTHIPASEVDLSAAECPDDAVDQWLAQDMATPFAMDTAPLMRVAVLVTGETSRSVVMTCHHLLTDGWTGQLLVVELARTLAEILVGDPCHAERHIIGDPETFGRAARLIADEAERTKEVWTPVLESTQPRLLAPGHHGGHPPALSSVATLGENETRLLTELATSLGGTFNTVCQVAWAHALNHITGGDTAVFGDVVSGRMVDVPGVEESIGCYTNTLPAVVSVPVDRTWRQTIVDVIEARRVVAGWEHLPLSEAHKIAGVRQLFDTLYVFQSYPPRDTELREALAVAGLELVGVRPGGTTDSAAVLMVFPAGSVLDGEGTRLVLQTAPDVVDAEESRILVDVLAATLHAIANNPEQCIGETRVVDDFDAMLLEQLQPMA